MVDTTIYKYAEKLSTIPRSICGPGIREVLSYIKKEIPNLKIKGIDTGSKVFDWVVPQEWAIKKAYIIDPDGRKFASYAECPLHIVQHSEPVNITLSLNELRKRIHVSSQLPNAIPYVTSYYKRDWGFCITQNELDNLKNGNYTAKIESELFDGELNYGEVFIQGETDSEILISTYICHPYMGNNESSGPAIAIELVKKLLNYSKQKYSIRMLFIPETIGSLAYLSENLPKIQKNTIGGFVLTCLGDKGSFSFVPARNPHSYINKVVHFLMVKNFKKFNKYNWFTDRGSDERQFCWPTINLDMVSITRSKYNEYAEYHTSLDDINFINADSLNESLKFILLLIKTLQNNNKYQSTTFGEPKLDKLGLYRTHTLNGTEKDPNNLINFLSMCDGETDLIDISLSLSLSFNEVTKLANVALQHNLIK